MDAEFILASGYAAFLVSVSAALEAVARYTHRRAQTSSTQGFTYVPENDLWRCPSGQHLHRESYDETFRIARYRAQPHHCNNCTMKSRCTDSNSGRVLEHQPESWVQSGMRRFHRGMSLTLLALAAMILVIEIVRQQQRPEQIFIAGFLLCLGLAGIRLASSLRTQS
ncbi:MAG TPA: transposase [Terriglobales bacterium]|nr:transposase [Terriglobales bacterium]